MLRHPPNEQDFLFSKWQPSSAVSLESVDAQPVSMSLTQLGSRPFDLSTAILTSADSAHKSKAPRLSTQLDDELSTPASTTDDDKSMPDEFITTTYDFAPDYMDDQDHEMEDGDIWTNTASAATNTSFGLSQKSRLLSWDDDNDDARLQDKANDHWTQYHSPYLTESASSMEALYYTKFPDTLVVENERLIKDVVYLLTGVSSLCFEWKIDERVFKICETGIRLADLSPGVVRHILQPMLLFGTRMKTLEDFSAYIQSHPALFGSVGISFACCLGELLCYLQHTIVSLFAPSSPSSTTDRHTHEHQLLEIHHRMEGFFFIMHHLVNLCTMGSSRNRRYDIPRGGELLTLLYNNVLYLDDLQTGYTGFLKAIYMTLLINASTPWLWMMTQWLNDGTLHDPYHDFFIVDNEQNNSAHMKINTAALPCFLSKKYAKMVLRAGMSILQQKVDPTKLDELDLSWLDASWSSNMECIINQQLSAETTPYPFDSPPTLSLLSDPDTHLQQEQRSVVRLGEWMTNQGNDYVPPLPILLRQQLLDPIQQRHQNISSLSASTSTTPIPSSLESMGRRDMLFTYWNGHSDQYPTTFYTDLVTSPFTLSTFLRQQRQHHTSLATPSSSLSSSSSNSIY